MKGGFGQLVFSPALTLSYSTAVQFASPGINTLTAEREHVGVWLEDAFFQMPNLLCISQFWVTDVHPGYQCEKKTILVCAAQKREFAKVSKTRLVENGR